jgi:hypothetical protein
MTKIYLFGKKNNLFEILDFQGVKSQLMVAWVMTLFNLIGGCQCFLGNLVPPSSLSKCSVPIILFGAEPLEILEEIVFNKKKWERI